MWRLVKLEDVFQEGDIIRWYYKEGPLTICSEFLVKIVGNPFHMIETMRVNSIELQESNRSRTPVSMRMLVHYNFEILVDS